MSLKFTYKGRTFGSARAMMDAMQRDLRADHERQVRRAASLAGARVRKTPKGFEIEGSADQVARFRDRLRRG